MQEEILTFQFGSFSNRILNDYWDIEQLMVQEMHKIDGDMNLNSTFIKSDSKRPRTLIFDLKENLQRYSFYQTNIDTESEKNQYKHWEKNKIQVFDLGEEQKVDPTVKKSTGSFNKFALSERNFARVSTNDSYFNVYQHGNHFVQNNENVDAIEDKIRFFLEESDYLRGFQCFLDTNSGYGPINKYVLQYLSEECAKKPVFQYAFDNDHYTYNKENEKILPSLRYLNKIVCLYELKEFVSWYLPIDVDNVLQFQGFNPALRTTPDKALNLLALMISNISLPYRFSNIAATSDSIKTFAEGLLFYPELNVFNACFQLGGDPEKSIFNYKENLKPVYLFSLPDYKDKLKNKQYTTFAEDYVVRGSLGDVKIPKSFNSVTHNYHTQELNVPLPEHVANLFDPKLLSNFETVSQGLHSAPIQKISTQSCTFTNELFKYYFEEIVKDYKKVERGAKLQFLKEDYAEDDFKEMEHFYHNLRDSYDNAREDRNDDDEDDDDDF